MPDEEEVVMDFGKKKKKEKKEKKPKEDDTQVELVETDFQEGELIPYEELLERVRNIIEAKHSGFGVKEKYTLTPPEVLLVL